MDYDSFLSMPRWQILEIIAKKSSSPVEISIELNTSVSYISQQLKLLEAANLVSKEKTGKADKGQPRNLYSLSKEIVYIKSLAFNAPSKKLINLTPYHKIVLNIWHLDDINSHHILQKYYYHIEKYLDQVQGIFFDSSENKQKLIVISEFKGIKILSESFFKINSTNFNFSINSIKDFEKNYNKKLFPIYVSSSLEEVINRLKGGDKKSET